MGIGQKAPMVLAAAVVILLFGCACYSPPQTEVPSIEEATVAAVAGEVSELLDPRAAVLDLEPVGLHVLWKHDLMQVAPGKKIRELYLVENTLFAEAGGLLFHFDRRTGVWRATTSLKHSLTQPPAVIGDSVYLMSGGTMHEVEGASGEILRQLSPRIVSTSPLVSYPPSLVLGSGSGTVIRFDLGTERHTWLTSTEGAVHTAPVIDGRNVYVAGYKGRAVAVTGDHGRVLWEWLPKRPSLLASGLCLAGDRLYIGDNRGYVYCLTAGEGMVVWRYPAGAPISSTPEFVRDRLVVFPYQLGALCLGVGSEPTLLWQHPDAKRLIATGAEGMYLLTRDHSVAYVLLETGEEKWRRPLPKGCSVVPDPSEPTFYLYMASGAIMALEELP